MIRCLTPLLVAAGLFSVVLSAALSAQGHHPLTGVITDEDGRPVAGAEIILTPAEGAVGPDVELGTTSGNDGRWTLCCVPLGTWRIRVRFDGYYEADGLVAVSGDRPSAPVDVSLRPLTEELPAFTELAVDLLEYRPGAEEEAAAASGLVVAGHHHDGHVLAGHVSEDA